MQFSRLFTLLITLVLFSQAQAQKTENVILITLDGLRWQEVFTGADSTLIDDSGYAGDPEKLMHSFWDVDAAKRRELLMPFFWSTIANEGQLYGNRLYENKVNVTNTKWFSYPGYNEILTGFADDENITSNNKIPNPNVTFLEYLNEQKEFSGKVKAFGSWDVFPYIVNEERSGIPVNAGFRQASENLTEIEAFLNKIQGEIRGPWGSVRLDVFTHHYAMESLKKDKPRVMYISYGETDDWAHGGKFDQYLYSARQTDAYIKELWDYLQSDKQYKDKTTLIITTDHGRGTKKKSSWRHHGSNIKNADQIWIAVMGPDTPALGEVKSDGQLYQSQVARTAVEALGLKYEQPKAGAAISGALK